MMPIQPAVPTFIRPRKISAAVPIVDPSNHDKQRPLIQKPPIENRTTNLLLKQKAHAVAQAHAQATGKTDVTAEDVATAAQIVCAQIEKLRVSSSVKSPPSHHNHNHGGEMHVRRGEDACDEMMMERGFDVYASPFVQEKIRAINNLPGRVCNTLPSKSVNLSKYPDEAFGGSRLLPAPPLPDSSYQKPSEWRNQPVLSPASYESFFRFHMDNEIQSQTKENASYSLYCHDGLVEFLSEKHARVTIVVPGLRENSPYVEEDDPIQLRQLRVDAYGRLVEGGQGFMSPEALSLAFAPHYTPGPWTDLVYNARVYAVKRATEELVVLVWGLTLQNSEVMQNVPQGQILPAKHRLKFNIQFPVPRERYLPMELVLPQIQASLARANRAVYMDKIPLVNHYWVQSMLFPTEADCDVQSNAQTGASSLSFYDNLLNLEQRIAVENICGQNYGVLPYLISGPPGTGKTKTMIEIALQLVNNVKAVSHILVCAPSEQAADTLADRLRSWVKPSEMLRLNRPTRAFGEVLDSIRQYCYYGDDMFALPPFEKLMSYKIVVTSCRDAHMLMYARMTNTDLYTVEHTLTRTIHPTADPPNPVRLHWDALLIDEAAQATEPEALVPLQVVAPPPDAPDLVFTPLVVMAGDEHQLNPRTSSPRTPLQRSLFTRLFARPVYADHPLARRFHQPGSPPPFLTACMLPVLRPAFTNLTRNYRSHPALLAVPSSLFYADTLIPSANAAATSRLNSWKGWTRPHWPLLFHNNPSVDDLERDGGGWYNAAEATLACEYAQRFVSSGLVTPEEVCIMSPFKAQVRRIRALIRSETYQLWGVNVGPTEAYQGLEHGVVILCVTRSRKRFVGRDKELGWGVIGQRNKMNVALTRAKFGLVVIGRKELLVGEDENWRAVVGFCERNGLCVGDGYDGNKKMNGEKGSRSGKSNGNGNGNGNEEKREKRTRIEMELIEEEKRNGVTRTKPRTVVQFGCEDS